MSSILLLALVDIFAATIAFIVIKSNRNSYTNKVFSSLILFTIIWVTSNYIGDHNSSLLPPRIILNIINASSSIVVWLLFVLSIVFPQKKYNEHTRAIVFSFLALLLLIFLLVCTNLIILEAVPTTTSLSVRFGAYAFLFVGFFILSIFISLLNLIQKFRRAKGTSKRQLQYLFLGFSLSTGISLITNLILPFFGIFGPSVYGIYSILFLLTFTAYSIIRHQLFDITSLIARGFAFFILLSFVSSAFVGSTIIVGTLLQDNIGNSIFIGFIVALIVVFGLDPLKRLLSRATDKIFFQAKINYVELTQNLSRVISVELDLQKLINDLEQGLVLGLKIKNSIILLRDQDNGKTKNFRANLSRGQGRSEVALDNASPLIQFVREHHHPSLLESLERKIEDTPEGLEKQKQEGSKAEFERLGVGLVAPIFSEDHLVAVLTLGPKLSGDSFSDGDIQLINVLAPQIGSAIQKANLYEEVREFSEGLKVKVDDATKELRDRNVSLQTLQTITKDITRTLDFGKVVQNIANAVATELGFLGAILVFLDDDGKTLRARAVTETPLTSKAIKLLPKKFTEYTTDMRADSAANLGTQVISSGEIRFTDSMTEVLCPPIPKPIVLMMQKVMGIRTMILVPIVSEEKVIGVIEVGAKRKREEISQREIETLQSMADELGVVARNITLFDRVRKTNDQLEVANKHLQELDRAKSEFVSIASHQLRTPMTGIMGYLSMMTQGDFGKIKPAHQKILTDLLSESQRMIRLINQFLNVSKIEAGKFTYTWKPTQFEDLVEHVVKEVQKPAADKGLKLSVKMPKKKLPIIQADMDKIEDVILNLLDNAIKYTAKGTITAIISLDDDQVHFAVKDSGIGIKPQDATELFNKFVRGSGIAQIHPDGSGLGLFIAKSIIDAHGGKIWTESEGEGKGSTFQFSLPMKPPANLESLTLNPAAHIVKPKDTVQTLKDE